MPARNRPVCITVSDEAVRALDRYYARRLRRPVSRPIRRVPNQVPVNGRHRMLTTAWTLGVLDCQALSGETLDQTIVRLAAEADR